MQRAHDGPIRGTPRMFHRGCVRARRRGWVWAALSFWALVPIGIVAQDLTPTTFLQREQVNNVMVEGTGFPRLGSHTDVPSRQPNELRPEVEAEAESSAAADAFEQVALALVPRALRFKFGLEFRVEYDSNITVGSSGSGGQDLRFRRFRQSTADATEDFILQGLVNLGMTWQFSGGNALGIDVGLGYRQYLLNPEFSGMVLNTNAPGGLAFRFATGEVIWTVFDHFSFNTNPGSQSELTGTSDYQSFTNTFGVDAAWSASDQIGLRAGVDRTYVSTESDQQELKRTSDALHVAFVYGVTPLIETGLSASLTFSRDENSFSTGSFSSSGESEETESTAIAVGPFFQGQITPFTKVFLSAGVQKVKFDESNNRSAGDRGSSDPSFYGNLRITNQLTDFYSHTFAIGRDTGLGVVSDSVATDYVRYSGRLRMGQRTSLNGNVFFENSKQSGGGGGGSISEKYKLYGGGLSVDVAVRPTVSASLGWQHTTRDSDQEGFDYKRELIFFSVAWVF